MSWRRRRPGTGDPSAADPDGQDAAYPADSEQADGPGRAGATADGVDAGAAGGPGAPAGAGDPAVDRSGGPFDVTEVDDDLLRIDLGALHLPAVPGMELRLEVEDGTQRIVAATVGLAGSTAQLQVFAAPRSEGIWAQVRSEIAASVTAQGGTADVVDGPLGRELLARVPALTPDGRTGHRPARFVGVDGPRWFLRAVVSGPAAVEPEAAAPLEGVLRGAVVVRGTEAMVPRELLPLRVPASAPSGGPAAPGAEDGAPLDRPGE